MQKVLKDNYFNEYYGSGFVETGMFLPDALVDDIKGYYLNAEKRRNDFPKFFVDNEHQAYLDGKALGTLFTLLPKLAEKMVKRLYDRTYESAVYADQAFIPRVCEHLLANGLGRFFRTRYFVVGYDILLSNDHSRSGAGIHTDLPNFHHFYETENDVTLYVPLVDLDDANGGRIMVLPESKLKISGNVLLKQLQDHFGQDGRFLDSDGYIDPERISAADLAGFIKSKPYQKLMAYYTNVIALARKRYSPEFEKCEETKGKVLLWNNKNFHAVEPWKNKELTRAVYIIRLFPIYDTKIKLKSRLHGKLFNNHLIDTETGEIQRQEQAIDISRIPGEYKLAL
jgi:hypothetical protein